VILLDANLLLYAYNTTAPEHPRARAWLEEIMRGVEPVGIPWATLLAFVRIATNPRVFSHPLAIDEAVAIVAEWLAQSPVVVPAPSERHFEILSTLLVDCQATGPLVTDAHLAALALEHGATLHTTDRDFARFTGLRFANPL
jgi:uncharacterized protein